MESYKLFLPILQVILTTDDANAFIESIDHLLTQIYKIESHNLIENMSQNLTPVQSHAFLTVLKQNSVTETNKEILKVFLNNLQDAIRHAEILKLTLAVSPSEEMLEQIASMVKELFGPTTLIEITIDKNIVGGAIGIYMGKYYDFTIESKLQHWFNEHPIA